MRSTLAPSLILCPLIAGCASVPARPLPLKIETVSSRSLSISDVIAQLRDQRVVVRGRVARAGMMPGAVWGHLHVEAIAGTRLVAAVDAQWSQLARRRLPRSSFWVRLPAGLPPIDTIRVSHAGKRHRDPRQSGTSS